MAFTMRVHQRDTKDPSSFIKIRPYMRFTEKGECPIFLQDGRFYHEDGKHINDLKGNHLWAFESAELLSTRAKKEVNYTSEIKKRGRPVKITGDKPDPNTEGAENGDD